MMLVGVIRQQKAVEGPCRPDMLPLSWCCSSAILQTAVVKKTCFACLQL
jgi:hypothetical protein